MKVKRRVVEQRYAAQIGISRTNATPRRSARTLLKLSEILEADSLASPES